MQDGYSRLAIYALVIWLLLLTNHSMRLATLLISLGRESFSNVTIEFEGTPEEAIAEGKRLLRARDGAAGLPKAEWDKFLTNLLKGSGDNHVNEWEQLSERQVDIVQEVKRALKRIDYEETKNRPQGIIK